MDLKLKPFDFAQAVARAGLRPDGMPIGSVGGSGAAGAASKTSATPEASFQSAMTQALRQVSDAQNEASALQQEFQLGNSSVSLEETMVSAEKARLGFTAAISVRNRLVQAYSEIMNMQV
ncbi:flagellar hook-basal body complex protein FliE [Aquabacterium sp.]|uniref:flagellar hook-basal body complex protein FliE n=1 Tax=Aquabacterium sp. TaxID=1872578 RepID=UPI002CFD2898|nr:flagellar hook-basal body complex protein FliE [Aquabacterium sp.]HSW04646.1 flagellar hook-basal body complex protein FliE [Aquabacterium sp.]